LVARIVVALFTAAALVFLPAAVLLFWDNPPQHGNEAFVVYGLSILSVAAFVLHAYLEPGPRDIVLGAVLLAAVLSGIAAAAVFFLVLIGGSCSDDGHVPPVSWIGGAFIYLAGATWALQRPRRTIWAVPCSLLAGGVWLVLTATALTGSTGACLD
jgi:hypothetical protein